MIAANYPGVALLCLQSHGEFPGCPTELIKTCYAAKKVKFQKNIVYDDLLANMTPSECLVSIAGQMINKASQ